jgi:putative component of toxin-antitoxin plasmid stabilization module
MKITGAAGTGILRLKSKTLPVCKEGQVILSEAGVYELKIEKGKTYTVQYSAFK